jgi:transposase-like protein
MYITNAVESVNMTLRKASRNHPIFPTDDTVLKVMYLAAQNIAKKWTMPVRNWHVRSIASPLGNLPEFG